MNIQQKLLVKACVWEVLSFFLGFFIMWIVTQRADLSLGVSVILLPIKAILLAIYDSISDKVLKIKRG